MPSITAQREEKDGFLWQSIMSVHVFLVFGLLQRLCASLLNRYFDLPFAVHETDFGVEVKGIHSICSNSHPNMNPLFTI